MFSSESALQITRMWNYRAVNSRREERDVQARRFNQASAAEESLAELVKNDCNYDGIRMRVRVPRYRREDDTSGRGEIDMILVNQDGIYVVEIKDFYGQVYTAAPQDGSSGEHWIQCARPNAGPKKVYVNHGDILNGIRLKAKALADYLSKTPIPSSGSDFLDDDEASYYDTNAGNPHHRKRLELPPGRVFPCLVFVNPECVVDPQALASHQFVFTSDSFKQFVGKKSLTYDWVSWMAPAVVPSNRLTFNQQLDTLSLIDTLPTWDTLIFHNGSVRTGDIVCFYFPEHKIGKSAAIPKIDRKYISDCTMTWPSTGYLGLLWTLVARTNLPTLYLYMKPNAQVPSNLSKNFLVGKAAADASASAQSNNSASPRQKKNPNNSNNGSSSNNDLANSNIGGHQRVSGLLQIRIGNQPGEHIRSQNVTHLVFKPAGSRETETIAVHHLTAIQMSLVSVNNGAGKAGRVPGL